jgi:hypothetical protein
MATTSDSLRRLAQEQVTLAQRGVILPTFEGQIIPPDMLSTAANTEGANLKAAYWLAIAARLAGAARKPSANALTSQAKEFLGKGSPGVFSAFSSAWSKISGDATNSESVATIFRNAASIAQQGGVPNVAQQLQKMADIGKVEQKQEETDSYFMNLWRNNPISSLNKLYEYRYYGIGAIAVLGIVSIVVAWINRNSIKSGAAKTAKAAAFLLV